MKNKKSQTTKLITRIIAILLAALLVIGMIIPHVAAETITAEENDSTDVGDTMKQTTTLPPGFEYAQQGDVNEIVKTQDNTLPAMKIDIPEGFDADSVVVYLGNLETGEVFYVQLYRIYNYVYTLNVPDGYYVLLSNDLIWCDSAKREYTIQGETYRYIYIGNSFDEDLYNVDVETTDGIFSISLYNATRSGDKVEHNISFIPEVTVKIPTNAFPMKKNVEEHSTEVGNKEQGDDLTETNEAVDEDDKNGPLSILLSIVKDSFTFIILGCVCGLIYFVLKRKKQNDLEKQINQDKTDDKSFK